MELVRESTLGAAWLEVARRILASGTDAAYDAQPTKELALLTLVVDEPDPDDVVIAELADPAWLDWMHRNFSEPEPDDVAELGGARSYARRLRDYGGRDQVAWVDGAGLPVGRLVIHCKSAHVYEPEYELMHGLAAARTA